MSNPKKFLWLDIETTGLDPQHAQILEIAAVFTDADMTVHKQMHFVVKPSPAREICWSLVCVDMHTKNGLIREAVHGENAIFLDDAISRITSILRIWARPKEVALAGRCVHFDRSFLKAYAPELEALLHHRHLDVAAIEMFLEHSGIKVERREEQSPHRALDDVLYAFDQYRKFLSITKPLSNG